MRISKLNNLVNLQLISGTENNNKNKEEEEGSKEAAGNINLEPPTLRHNRY